MIDRKKTYIIVANHTSMLDIMMTYVTIPNVFMFIGKKELERLPIFGYFYKRTNILVDRKSLASRRDVFFEARSRLRENLGLCIYPEGGVPTDSNIDLWPFKIGAFRLAVEEGVDILPITFPDTKRHQPYHITQGGYPGRVRAIIHPPISVVGKNEKDLRDETRDLILKTLLG
ncbi:MAG: 1-acyl-sn-glycerol-3-phosphate acyltransferase [Cryomorphaceae bacterium]|nr:1-acyl-sn-glycerol-3-phosphate acyltransferase [Cryomorphaceae bacterium]